MKIIRYSNWRVEVTPVEPWFTNSENEQVKMIDACNDLIKEIKRHCDGIESINYDYDQKEICSFCNYEWDADKNGMPACCNAAREEFAKENNIDLKTYNFNE